MPSRTVAIMAAGLTVALFVGEGLAVGSVDARRRASRTVSSATSSPVIVLLSVFRGSGQDALNAMQLDYEQFVEEFDRIADYVRSQTSVA